MDALYFHISRDRPATEKQFDELIEAARAGDPAAAQLEDNFLMIVILPLLLLLAPACVAQTKAVEPLPKTTLVETPNFVAARSGRYLIVELRRPHRVLSTSGRAGGQSEAVRYLVNHQSSEAGGDVNAKMASMSREQSHDEVAKELGLDPAQVAIMGTAANMNHLGYRSVEFRDVTVYAFVTAGVAGNAARADDKSDWLETGKGFEKVDTNRGTINTILIVNKPLTPGAMARAAITMVEAKSAALSELAVPSLYSTHIATGTGTDQFIIAAPLAPEAKPLEWPGSSTKLGQMIGEAVRGATLEALRWQNGLEPSATRSIVHALKRFGLSDAELQSRLKKALPEKNFQLFLKNPWAITMDPAVSAAAFTYAAVLDRLQYGTLPEPLADEVLRYQAAVAAAALAAQPARLAEFWNRITAKGADRLGPLVEGLAFGWQARWQ